LKNYSTPLSLSQFFLHAAAETFCAGADHFWRIRSVPRIHGRARFSFFLISMESAI
jgi:hypothetical protein